MLIEVSANMELLNKLWSSPQTQQTQTLKRQQCHTLVMGKELTPQLGLLG